MTDQVHDMVLTEQQLEDLGPALGRFDGEAGVPAIDVCDHLGRPVVLHGLPGPGFEEVCSSIVEAQGMAVITITGTTTEVRPGRLLDSPGEDPGSLAFAWFSRYGILTASPTHDEGYRVALERGGGLYRFLVDVLQFGPRPEPAARVRLEVPRAVMQSVAQEDFQAPAAVRSREALSAMLDGPWPEVAADLRAGRYRQVTVATQFNGAHGLAEGGTWYLDTPHGILVHQKEQRVMRRNRDLLLSTPSWELWSELLATLPQPEDVGGWLDTTA
jgi:hypothetical protein